MIAKCTESKEPILHIIDTSVEEKTEETSVINLKDKKEELRRQMYERIAQGNALADIENRAGLSQQGL